MGGMNIMFVRSGKLITPALTGTILPGVTRDSILKLAPAVGIPASEETIHLQEIVEGIRSGEVTEAIACGTAAVLTGIRSFRMEDGSSLRLPEAPGPVTAKLYDRLSGIQFGRYPDEYGWLTTVCRI
jgi:branched-chain amino acid aminotransferase